ncbi:sensor histidine kinase [Sphingomonas lenta]|uniref:sensor histidine kinase n=1 Tax=Sphingomonas lenta TaxID=1141887 RepID=UPI00159573A9|nr:HWE histidine kinase domain-containing protein [Sphingomonas lenta]
MGGITAEVDGFAGLNEPEVGMLPGRDDWCEAGRLSALTEYQILDTAAEPSFNDAVLVAAQLCDAPIALVSLVDEQRQWFKAAVGLTMSETPRDISFCGHAIREPDLFIVEDAASDLRFVDNPLVTGEPFIRFYAGAPLVTSEGFAIGTICVLDHRPRTLSEGQRVALTALARQVVAQLDLRRLLARHEEGEEHRRLLTGELEHRIKNTLSVVQAIVSQTLRTATTPAGARDAISARLVTLGRAHDLLTQASWTAAPIDALVKGAVGDYGEDSGRIRVSGPGVRLNARAALAISMALHELATNAAKYGALSNEAGHIEISWRVDQSRTPAILEFVWQEAGGPPVSAPTRKGFGTRLIETSLTRDLGRGRIEYLPAGVRWSVSANLANVQEPSTIGSEV